MPKPIALGAEGVIIAEDRTRRPERLPPSRNKEMNKTSHIRPKTSIALTGHHTFSPLGKNIKTVLPIAGKGPLQCPLFGNRLIHT